jgi:hypothetical protein
MNLDPTWVPMNWPCGPLEWARRSRSKNVSAELKQTLDAWAQPAALELLKGTPVNCLLLEWADGAPEDSTQPQSLKPLLEAGRRRGIEFVARITNRAAVPAAVTSARAAGFSAVLLTEPPAQSFDLPVILQFPRDKVAWKSATPIFSSTENEWPGLRLDTMQGDTAVAGPTGIPWINSNGWFSLLANELAHGKTRWLSFEPPTASGAHPANYALAVADSQAYGSRWVISLDDNFRAALLKETPQAKKSWADLGETLSFFEQHREWEEFQAQAVLAVISDFLNDNAFLGGEVLNLLNRHQIQFRVMERSQAFSTPMPNLKAALWLDHDSPRPEQLAKLLAFVRRGGLLIAAAYWGPSGITPTDRDPSLDYKMYTIGQGQIAVSAAGFLDPYQVAMDAHLLVSRRNDLVRLYNPETTNCHLSCDPVHKRRLVQMLNYASSPAGLVTLWVKHGARSAQLWSPAGRGAVSITGAPAGAGTEFGLPPIAVNCALEVEVFTT